MAKLKGNILICHNTNATEEHKELFYDLAIMALNSYFKGVDGGKEAVNALLDTVQFVPVEKMTEEGSDGKLYPTSPFRLVVDHRARVPFHHGNESELPGLRWDIDLPKLGKEKKGVRWAYAAQGLLSQCFPNDYDGIARLSKLEKVTKHLSAWKQTMLAKLEEEEYTKEEIKDISVYDLRDKLGDQWVGHTPYCINLPQQDSCIISTVVAQTSKAGKLYLKQLTGWHWNVGLTHTGGSFGLNPVDVMGEEALAITEKLNALKGKKAKGKSEDSSSIW